MSQTRPWTGWATCLLKYTSFHFPLRSGFVTEGHGMDWKCRGCWWITQNFWEFLSFGILKLIAVFTQNLFVGCWWSSEYPASSSCCVNELGEDDLRQAWHEPKLSVVLFWCHVLDCRNFQSPDQIWARVNSFSQSDFAVSLCEGNQSVYTSVRALRQIYLYLFFKVSSPKTIKKKRNWASLECLFFLGRT